MWCGLALALNTLSGALLFLRLAVEMAVAGILKPRGTVPHRSAVALPVDSQDLTRLHPQGVVVLMQGQHRIALAPGPRLVQTS